MIVFHETSLRRTLTSYFDYYHRSRTHLSVGKDAPDPRAIHPPQMGSVGALPLVGGLPCTTATNDALPERAQNLTRLHVAPPYGLQLLLGTLPQAGAQRRIRST